MYVDVFVSFFPETKFILSFIRRLAFKLRSSHFGSLSLVLISVLFGFCCSFLPGICHLWPFQRDLTFPHIFFLPTS